MTAREPGDDPQRWFGLLDNLSNNERNSLVDSMRGPRPRIEIDEALREGWLEIWYQPKIDLRRKCLAGAEALARIHHPTLGVLLPDEFLQGVDEASIAHLTEHALLTTLRDWTAFDEAGSTCIWRSTYRSRCCSNCRCRRWFARTGRRPRIGRA